jgi:hypothetical protein
MPRLRNPNMFQNNFFMNYPAKTFDDPLEIVAPQPYASPSLPIALLFTNTVEEKDESPGE